LKEAYKGKMTGQELRQEYQGKVPEWQTPEVVIIEEMPLVARYKYDKGALKKRFADYYK
jgi:acyl-CoA synthetase (AMP-forming)/AMP-acid ligase II